MSKFLPLVLLAMTNLNTQAIDTLTVKSSIKHVTVYLSGAEVNRLSELNVAPGKVFIRFNDLPFELNPSTIQAKSGVNFEILSVKHFIEDNSSFKRSPEMRSIEEEQKKIQQQIQLNNQKKDVYRIEEQVLFDNREMNSAKGEHTTDLKQTADFYRNRLMEIRESQLKLSFANDKLQEQVVELNKDLNQASAKVNKVSSSVLVAIESKNGGAIKLNLSYFIISAGWSPVYDFRYKNVNAPLNLVYQANVYQNSGEHWDNVMLTLSNNKPAVMGSSPVLERWYLDRMPSSSYNKNLPAGAGSLKGTVTDRDNNEPVAFANVVVKNKGQVIAGSTSDFDGNYYIKPLQSGSYDVEVNFVGYSSSRLEGVQIRNNQITYQNFSLGMSVDLAAVEVVAYAQPLIQKDASNSVSAYSSNRNGVSRESIQRMPARDGNVRGSRGEGNFIYIDGVKVRESSNLPRSGINEISVISGGTPANYGGYDSDYEGVSNPASRSFDRSRSDNTTISMNDKETTSFSVDYEIQAPYSIKSDGLDNTIRIKSIMVPANYVHYAVPKLDPATFITAELVNWQSLNLLNGTANLYFGGTFIGESMLDVQNTDDTLVLSLGRDPEVVVERNAVKEQYERKTIGSTIKETFSWDLMVRNNKGYEINLVLQDQYPLAVQKSIETELLESTGAKINEEEGILLWKSTVKPGEKKVYHLKYSIRYPQNFRVYK